ncbi:hypothetical protein MKW98_015215 [Papaver atlanticum]|uniref:Ribosomal protein L34Ae n=1 Tax=Papaver atlanticum TaxID=357466 RepID=A0AAD4T6L0_9MAGN|nr:hypothetical protein MKW98_015215 [Papaver atlanticum]
MKGDSKETLILLFFNAPISFHLLFSFFNVSSTLLANFFFSIYDHLIPLRSTCNDDDGYHASRHEEEHDHHQYAGQKREDGHGFFSFDLLIMEQKEDHLVADIIHGGESLLFIPFQSPKKEKVVFYEGIGCQEEIIFQENSADEVEEHHIHDYTVKEDTEEEVAAEDSTSYHNEDPTSDDDQEELIIMEEEHSPEYFSPPEDSDEEASELDVAVDIHHQDEELSLLTKDSDANSATTTMVFISTDPSENGYITPVQIDLNNSGPVPNDDTSSEEERDGKESKDVKNTMEIKMLEDGKFFVLQPKKIQKNVVEDDMFEDTFSKKNDMFGDSVTEGSTSKSSSEWRNSVNYRDSGTGDDPFSTSSRRSCPTWESYTVFRKYDEEMLFLDRISAQKLSETESLRAIEACPRSISHRIVHKLTTKNKPKYHQFGRRNPYQELETAYVAQICLTWEALNWNYKNYQRLKATYSREDDPGCPGQIAQQFQQFQVLLQRFIENEPYEHGRRPEIYARIRNSAPKLLQVPEFREEDNNKKAGFANMTVSSIKFSRVMEDAIRTFMKFLKEDKEKPCDIFKAFFKRNTRQTVDPTYLHLMRKSNKRKKMRIEDLRRAGKCIRKRKLKEEEEMEILMSLIDLKVVSRVLRMTEISEEQLHWCEEKMNKIRVWEGKLQRDSSPLFFPTH